MITLVNFVKCLPILLGLYKSIEAAIEKYETEKSVADHLAEVKNAYTSGDFTKLNAMVNGVPNGTDTASKAN